MKTLSIFGIASTLFLVLSCMTACSSTDSTGGAQGAFTPVYPKCAGQSTVINFELATFVTPRNFPEGLFNHVLMDEYYQRTARVGCYVSSIINWSDADNPDLEALNVKITSDSKGLGFKVILQSNPLTYVADAAGSPDSVAGSSFTEPAVREAYKQHLLFLASLEPDILFTAVELNNLLFHGNQAEFDAFKQFSVELYSAIKQKYPNVTISISFQLDIFNIQGNYTALQGFENSLDIYSFTSYPTLFGISTVAGIPGGADYYTDIKNHLPLNARVAMAENGWSSADFSNEFEQAEFYRRLPDMYGGLAPEFVVISYLHDYPLPANPDDMQLKFSSMGLFNAYGSAKPAFSVIEDYYEK